MSDKVYFVTYNVRGSRCNGSFLVGESNKKSAKQVVKQVNPDYYGLVAYEVTGPQNIETSESILAGCYVTDLLTQDVVDQILNGEKSIFLESGT